MGIQRVSNVPDHWWNHSDRPVVGYLQSLEAELNSIDGVPCHRNMPNCNYAKRIAKHSTNSIGVAIASYAHKQKPLTYLSCRGHYGLFGLAQSVRLFITAPYLHFNARRLKDKQFSLKAHTITNARAADLHMVIDASLWFLSWLRLSCPLIVIRIQNQFTHADFACIEIDFVWPRLLSGETLNACCKRARAGLRLASQSELVDFETALSLSLSHFLLWSLNWLRLSSDPKENSPTTSPIFDGLRFRWWAIECTPLVELVHLTASRYFCSSGLSSIHWFSCEIWDLCLTESSDSRFHSGLASASAILNDIEFQLQATNRKRGEISTADANWLDTLYAPGASRKDANFRVL